MKKLLILLILSTFFLSGCDIYNLNTFVLPDDAEFLALIQELDNPKKICQYMKDNFEYEAHPYIYLTPYQLYITKKGDCYDYAMFAQFIANYHGYKTWQIVIYFKETVKKHALVVYLENGKYTYSNNKAYYPIYSSDFNNIVLDYFSYACKYTLNYYKVLDYNLITL